jgi:hypothetical protein
MQASTALNETRLPRQVLRRSAAIEARLAAAKSGPEADPADPNAPPAQTAAQPAGPQPGDTPVPADPPEQGVEYWKQRFLSSEGRIKAQARTHREEVDALHQQVSELTEQIRTLQASAPAPKVDLGEFLTPEQVEALGEEQAQLVVETAVKAMRKQVDATIAAAVKPLQDREARQRKDDSESRKRDFVAEIEASIPDYDEVDKSPGWNAWLTQEDPTSGIVRGELLTTHISRANAAGVVRMFKAYKATLPKTPTPPVAAAGSGAGPSGDAPAAPTHGLTRPTPAEITTFYTRCSTKRKGQPGYVTDQERIEFEKRLKLVAAPR